MNTQRKMMDFAIQAIPKTQSIEQMCYVFILIMEFKIFFIILEYVISSKVMISKINFSEKNEVYDEFYNYLLCPIKFIIFQSPSHIQNDVFHDQYSIKWFIFF